MCGLGGWLRVGVMGVCSVDGAGVVHGGRYEPASFLLADLHGGGWKAATVVRDAVPCW